MRWLPAGSRRPVGQGQVEDGAQGGMATLWRQRQGKHAKKDPAAGARMRRKDARPTPPGDGHERKLATQRRKRAT